MGKLSFGKDMDKEVPYKIDVKMCEPSEEDKGIETIGLKEKGISEKIKMIIAGIVIMKLLQKIIRKVSKLKMSVIRYGKKGLQLW